MAGGKVLPLEEGSVPVALLLLLFVCGPGPCSLNAILSRLVSLCFSHTASLSLSLSLSSSLSLHHTFPPCPSNLLRLQTSFFVLPPSREKANHSPVGRDYVSHVLVCRASASIRMCFSLTLKQTKPAPSRNQTRCTWRGTRKWANLHPFVN